MEIKTETKIVQYIEYDGYRFYKDGRGYWLSSNGLKKSSGKTGPVRLHIYVWEKYNGPIPAGHEVHHKDHNPDNNEIENLELLKVQSHREYHDKERRFFGSYHNPSENARIKAAEYHRSEEGRAWHREHYKNSIGPLHSQKLTKNCVVCGNEFQYSASKPDSKYCSARCKERSRPKRTPPKEIRTCFICGSQYEISIYSPGETCSHPCAMQLRRLRHPEGVKKHGKDNENRIPE